MARPRISGPGSDRPGSRHAGRTGEPGHCGSLAGSAPRVHLPEGAVSPDRRTWFVVGATTRLLHIFRDHGTLQIQGRHRRDAGRSIAAADDVSAPSSNDAASTIRSPDKRSMAVKVRRQQAQKWIGSGKKDSSSPLDCRGRRLADRPCSTTRLRVRRNTERRRIAACGVCAAECRRRRSCRRVFRRSSFLCDEAGHTSRAGAADITRSDEISWPYEGSKPTLHLSRRPRISLPFR